MRSYGSGGVYLVDASAITHPDVADAETNATASGHDLKLHALSSGDRRPRIKGAEDKADICGGWTALPQ
jgi:cyanophycinase-like exopeptidase